MDEHVTTQPSAPADPGDHDSDGGQIVKFKLEMIYEIRPGETIMDVMDNAKQLLMHAREHASATGYVDFGRDRKYHL